MAIVIGKDGNVKKRVKIRLQIELEYDADLMHGDCEKGRAWFLNEILAGSGGALFLGSNEIGDVLGPVTVLRHTSAPDGIDYDKTGDLDDVVLSDVSMFRMERMDDERIWIRCYRDGRPDVVFHLASAQKINGSHEFD